MPVKLPGTSAERGRGSLTLEWWLPASHNSSEPTGTTQPSSPLTVSGAPLRSSASLFYSSGPQRASLPTVSSAVQLPHFGSHFILNLLISVRPATCLLPRVCCQALLTFTPLWSVPRQTVSPRSLPSHIPAAVALACPRSPFLSLVIRCSLCVAQYLLEL